MANRIAARNHNSRLTIGPPRNDPKSTTSAVQNLGAREQRRSRYGLLSLSHQANSIEFKLGLRKRLQLGWGICG
jgi:hypothetical protein